VAGLSCGSCGAELPPNSKFCNECGAPVAEVSRSAEYKQVTVMFADVARSMDIAAAVGAERLREIMARLVDRPIAVVQRYGGTVDKFTGDGVMAVFGAPAALEDHAIRACLAALGVQDELRAAVDDLVRAGQLLSWGIPATSVLVETLLDSGADGDVAEAEAAIERLADTRGNESLAMRDLWLLRLRARLARAHGDAAACTHFLDRYSAMATSLDFEGHIAWAEACHDRGQAAGCRWRRVETVGGRNVVRAICPDLFRWCGAKGNEPLAFPAEISSELRRFPSNRGQYRRIGDGFRSPFEPETEAFIAV
jgi:Adenylate and Guanylate cyclase catalytic domain/zinc-ribbon domain